MKIVSITLLTYSIGLYCFYALDLEFDALSYVFGVVVTGVSVLVGSKI